MSIPKTIAIIGVGNMGGCMAANLLAKGFNVLVSDIDAEKVDLLVSKGAVAQSLQARAAPELVVIEERI